MIETVKSVTVVAASIALLATILLIFIRQLQKSIRD